MPKVFFTFNMNNLLNEHQNGNFKSNGSFCNFHPNLPETSLLDIMIKKRLYLKQVPFKYRKWKIASEIGHFVILPKLTQNVFQF